jgi:hypothetical protein
VNSEPEDDRSRRRDARTVEIASALLLVCLVGFGPPLVVSLAGRALGLSGSVWTDVLVAVSVLSAVAAVLLVVRRAVRLRRSGL